MEELGQAVDVLSPEQRKQLPGYWLLMVKMKEKGKGC
jgi:hypothetical protein